MDQGPSWPLSQGSRFLVPIDDATVVVWRGLQTHIAQAFTRLLCLESGERGKVGRCKYNQWVTLEGLSGMRFRS